VLRRSPLVAVAVVFVLGGSAEARPGPITVVSNAKRAKPAKETIAFARCGGEKKVLGGGFQSEPGTAFHQAYPEVSRPDGDDGWKVRVVNSSTLGRSLQFRVYAICQRNPGSLRRVIELENAPDRARPTLVVARCPGAEQVVGGGFAVDGEGADDDSMDGTLLASHPFADVTSDWTVSFDPIGPGLTVNAIAVCRKQGPGQRQLNKRGTVGPQAATTVEVGCPAGKPHVVTGGFRGPEVIPISSHPTLAGDAWKVTATNPSGAGSATFRAFAVCQ
jgi:hypothetical protein